MELYLEALDRDEKKPGGFFSKMAMAFGIGECIRQGINNAAGHPIYPSTRNSAYEYGKAISIRERLPRTTGKGFLRMR